MNAIVEVLGLAGTIGIGLGLIGVLLLMVTAARISRVIDLLDEIADLLTTEERHQEDESIKTHENQPA